MPRIDKPIIIALTLFIILLLIFFLVSPEYQKFKELQTDLGIKKAEYNAQKDYYAEIARSYYELKNREDDLKKIDNALPSDPNLGRLSYFIQEESAKSGLILKSLFLTKASTSASNSAGENTIKGVSLSLSLVGNYSSLGNFISALENSARLFEIASISFGAGDTANLETQFQTQSIYTFSMQVNTNTY